MLSNLKILTAVILSFTFLLVSNTGFSQHGKQHETEEHESKFNPGEMIMGHVGDEYGWHITTFGETHITIPLPIIVYSKNSGLSVFMSSKFNHGHSEYNNFKIANGNDNPNKGKVVEIINGEEIRPYDISITKNTLSLFISIIFILWIFISVAKAYTKREGQAPKGLQSFIEPLIIFIRDDIA